MGLRLKLLLAVFAAIAMVVISTWLIVGDYIDRVVLENQQTQALTTLHVFKATIESGERLDLKVIQQQANALKQAVPNYSALHFHIYKDGKVITAVSTRAHEIGKPSDVRDELPFRTGRRDVLTENDKIEIHEPLRLNGKIVGVVGVYMKKPDVSGMWRRASVFVLSSALMLLTVIYAAISRLIVSPIRKLERATARVAAGSLEERLESERRDEFGSLVAHFNEMLTALEVRDSENHQIRAELESSRDQARAEAHTDTLTQLFNRRYLEKQIEIDIAAAAKTGQPLTCLFCDLDGFKNYNDVHGHQAGDEALKTVALIIRACLREADVAARYGGEEFALVLPDTDIDGARAVADRIRRAVANFAGKEGKTDLTISIGVAKMIGRGQTAAQLLHDADQAMYAAKRRGKNCIVVYKQNQQLDPKA